MKTHQSSHITDGETEAHRGENVPRVLVSQPQGWNQSRKSDLVFFPQYPSPQEKKGHCQAQSQGHTRPLLEAKPRGQ